MVETKTIILNEQEIIYKIHYKRIKNCYLRVEKGEVVIRCSPMFPQNEIEKLIRNHQEEILEQIKGYVPKYNYQEDGYVYLFNQKYQIVLKDMNIYYMYLILIIINGIIGMFAYIMSIVTLSTSEDGIYKDLARIFGIVSITNALFAIYVFDNLNYDTLNKEIEITLVNLGVQASLYILFVYIYSKKNKMYKGEIA